MSKLLHKFTKRKSKKGMDSMNDLKRGNSAYYDSDSIEDRKDGYDADDQRDLWFGSQCGVLYVGDKILLANKRRGKVTSLGRKLDKDGIWVRVVLEKQLVNANDVYGSHSNQQQMQGKAIWVPINRVAKIVEKGNKFNFTIGDRVVYQKKKNSYHGIVRYVGPTHFEKGVWFGVELDDERGKNNGTVKKKFYFNSKDGHGVFVSQRKLIHEIEYKRKHASNNDSNNHNNNSNNNHDSNSFDNNNSIDMNSINNDSNNNDNNNLDINNNKKKKLILKERTNVFENFLYLTDDDIKLNDDNEININDHNNSSNNNNKKRASWFGKKSRENSSNINGNINNDINNSNNTMDKIRQKLNSNITNNPILQNYNKNLNELRGIELELYNCELPQINEVIKDRREETFKKKLYLCRAKCDFSEPINNKQDILMKKKERMLLELSEFIAKHVWFKESLYEECLKTVSNNLFRPLPYQKRPPALSFFNDEVFDKDQNYEDPSWRHLKLVYDLTWRVINTPQVTANMMEKHMMGNFLLNLVELFASEDHRERAYLMMILHKIYGRCLKLRPYIINIMCGYFYRMIYSDEFIHVNGIIELLQIICAIIPGLTQPVKESWQQFVRNVLVPLHKCRGLKKFWEQLTQCCVNYVAKDGNGGAVILGGLLKFWPKQSPQKEEIFIMEVVNIINVLITHQHGFEYENYKKILIASADKLTQCMLSTRQPVAERAIAAWKEQSMQRLVDYDRKAFLPKLCEAFYKNKDHTNQALKTSSQSVEKIYRSKDSAYWKKMQLYLGKKEKKERAIAKQLEDAKKKHENAMLIIQKKHAKDKEKKKPKPLTAAERAVKREYHWTKVALIAQQNNNTNINNDINNNNNNNNNNNINNIKRKVIKNCPKCINGKFTIKTIILQEGSKECNQCSKISKPKEIFYKCNNCGYDICPHCYHKVPMKLLKYKKNNNNIE